MIAVFSRPPRDPRRTVEQLDGRGGGSTYDGLKLLWWVGETPAPELPPGWRVHHVRRPPGGSIVDFWELLRFAGASSDVGDLHVFEDDVIPCRNLIPYVERSSPRPFLTTYFNPWGRPVSAVGQVLTDAIGFDCSQAMTIPRGLVDRLAETDPTEGTGMVNGREGHDLALNYWCRRWGQRIMWHLSLVQHEKGPSANGKPRPRWLRDPNFVGEDFDALTLDDDPPTFQPVIPMSFAGLIQR